MPSDDTDKMLNRVQNGDRSALESLMTRYRERLRRMISVFLDPRLSARIDVSDVLQEALGKAAVRLPEYLENRPIDFYPWLRGLVRDELVRLHREHVIAQRRSVYREAPMGAEVSDASVQLLADQLVSNESSPSQRASSEEIKAKVKIALAELSESDREILLMRCAEQLKVNEIAIVGGITEAAAKARLRRAFEKIGRLLRSKSS